MGITRDSRHKRSATGARHAYYRKKRQFELGRQAANTRIGPKRIHDVRVRGGNIKPRALRLDSGNFAWGSEHITAKTRILGVVYNASNNELVRTNTLVKGAVIQIDATPFRMAYEKLRPARDEAPYAWYRPHGGECEEEQPRRAQAGRAPQGWQGGAACGAAVLGWSSLRCDCQPPWPVGSR